MSEDRSLPAVKSAWIQACEVNADINRNTEYRSDLANFGRPDFWEYANGTGDCEDYALLKQQHLRALGWDLRKARLATCISKPPNGPEDHVVLLVSLAGGDYVLDNNVPDILTVSQCGYRFCRIQVPGEFLWDRPEN